MNRFASLLALALLPAGCVSRGALPPTAANTPPPAPAPRTPPVARVVELRHFYLLSPGPSATLVVTRSEMTDGESTAPH
jgi:hypothetical protein